MNYLCINLLFVNLNIMLQTLNRMIWIIHKRKNFNLRILFLWEIYEWKPLFLTLQDVFSFSKIRKVYFILLTMCNKIYFTITCFIIISSVTCIVWYSFHLNNTHKIYKYKRCFVSKAFENEMVGDNNYPVCCIKP